MERVGVLTGWFALSESRICVWLGRETIIDSRCATLCRPKTVAGVQWHGFLSLTLQSSNVRTVKDVIIGNSGVDLLWPGAHKLLAICPSLALRIITKVCFRPLLDGIPFNHWNRVYHHGNHRSKPDDLMTLQIWVRPRLHYVSHRSSP